MRLSAAVCRPLISPRSLQAESQRASGIKELASSLSQRRREGRHRDSQRHTEHSCDWFSPCRLTNDSFLSLAPSVSNTALYTTDGPVETWGEVAEWVSTPLLPQGLKSVFPVACLKTITAINPPFSLLSLSDSLSLWLSLSDSLSLSLSLSLYLPPSLSLALRFAVFTFSFWRGTGAAVDHISLLFYDIRRVVRGRGEMRRRMWVMRPDARSSRADIVFVWCALWPDLYWQISRTIMRMTAEIVGESGRGRGWQRDEGEEERKEKHCN